jgi:hypothetical protein
MQSSALADDSFVTAVRFHISVASAVRRATFKE